MRCYYPFLYVTLYAVSSVYPVLSVNYSYGNGVRALSERGIQDWINLSIDLFIPMVSCGVGG